MAYSGSAGPERRGATCRRGSANGTPCGSNSAAGASLGVWDLLLQALADSGGALDMLQMIDSTIVRAHRCAAGEITEAQNQALGRSRGGFSTKIHLRCNAAGLPIGVILSEGEAHDVTAYDGLMQQRDSDPGAMLADKGYDSDAIRHNLRDSGATPEIPTKSNRKVQSSVSKPLYALRSRIECFIGHLKEQRRIATRYDKLATSFVGFVLLGCIRIWARFVHRAYDKSQRAPLSVTATRRSCDWARYIAWSMSASDRMFRVEHIRVEWCVTLQPSQSLLQIIEVHGGLAGRACHPCGASDSQSRDNSAMLQNPDRAGRICSGSA